MSNEEYKKIITECEVQKDASGEPVFIVSKEQADLDGDIISIKGIDLKQFKKNPLMLWSHSRTEPAIGVWENIKKTKDKDGVEILTMKPKFSSSSNHTLARIVKDLVDEGVIKAASISFRPDWSTVEYKTIKNKEYRMINKSELFEVSIVNIGCNPAALAKAVDKGLVSKEDIEILNKEVEINGDSLSKSTTPSNDSVDIDTVEISKEDLMKQIEDKDIVIAELTLLVKEQEMLEEVEQDIYSELFDAFVATSDGELSADGIDQNESDDSLDAIYELL